jgi:hypothetical protein
MRKKIKALLCAFAILAGGCAENTHAAAMTGNDLLNMCQGVDTGHATPLCTGYLLGFLSGDATAEAIMMMRYQPLDLRYEPYTPKNAVSIRADWCLPPNVTNDQLMRVMYKYLVDHPESTNLTVGALLHLALTTTFPCK